MRQVMTRGEMGTIAAAHLCHLFQTGGWPEISKEAPGRTYEQTVGQVQAFAVLRQRPGVFGGDGFFDFFGPLNRVASKLKFPLNFQSLPREVTFEMEWSKLMAFDAWSYLIFNRGLPAPLTTIKRWYGDHAKALGTQPFYLCYTVRSIHDELMKEETIWNSRAHRT